MNDAILTAIHDVVKKLFPRSTGAIEYDTHIADIRGWDSVEHVPFMLDIEDALGIEFAEGSFYGFVTIGDIANYARANSRRD